jgi:hypothetical protein
MVGRPQQLCYIHTVIKPFKEITFGVDHLEQILDDATVAPPDKKKFPK